MKNVKFEYIEPIIKFAYNNNIKTFRNGNFSENFMFNMIMVCDQLLIEDVRAIFEIMISERICIRNCGEFLSLGKNYNCQIITSVCMKFICHNLDRALESQTLDSLDSELLSEISQFYRACFNMDAYRNITPDTDAISDEDLAKFVEEFELDFPVEEEIHEIVPVKPKQKAKYPANKSELDRRAYEKEAMALISILSIENKELPKSTKKISEDANLNLQKSEELVKESWQKVALDKKDPKKKMIFAAIRSNEVMRNEEKSYVDQFVSLKALSKSPDVNDESVISRNSFTLADYEFKQGKSKKGKNRQSSEGDRKFDLPSISTSSEIIESPQNPWNLSAINAGSSNSKNLFDDSFPAPNLTLNVSSNPAKSRKSQTLSPQSSSSKNAHNKLYAQENFHSILKDEIKEKQQFEKTRTKSLMLTQMEEEAIEQLKQFYNIDRGIF